MSLLALYLASRLFTTSLLLVAWGIGHGVAIAHFDGGPDFWQFLQSWDGKYYARIALHGYPSQLPVDSSGTVQKNAWAFLPVYPALIRCLMWVGIDVNAAGIIVAICCGFTATLALHRVVSLRFTRRAAWWASVFFCFGPMSFLLEVGYAESAFLTFMFVSLALLMSRRYLALIPFGVAASFAHPGALALAATLSLHLIIRRHRPVERTQQAAALVALVTVGLAGVAWPVIAAAVTHNNAGYFETELAWWHDYIGRVRFLPFTPWFIFVGHYWGTLGIALVIAVLFGAVWWLTRPTMRQAGFDLLVYTGAYLAYLVAVFLPQQSLIRMLLPVSPLLGMSALSRTSTRRCVTLVTCMLLQPIGILLFWVIWPP